MTSDDNNDGRIEASNGGQAKRRQKLTIAFTTLPQGKFWHIRVSVRQQSWRYGQGPFLKAALPTMIEASVQATAADGKTKTLINPPTR